MCKEVVCHWLGTFPVSYWFWFCERDLSGSGQGLGRCWRSGWGWDSGFVVVFKVGEVSLVMGSVRLGWGVPQQCLGWLLRGHWGEGVGGGIVPSVCVPFCFVFVCILCVFG